MSLRMMIYISLQRGIFCKDVYVIIHIFCEVVCVIIHSLRYISLRMMNKYIFAQRSLLQRYICDHSYLLQRCMCDYSFAKIYMSLRIMTCISLQRDLFCKDIDVIMHILCNDVYVIIHIFCKVVHVIIHSLRYICDHSQTDIINTHAFLDLHHPSRSCSCSLSRNFSLSVSLSVFLPLSLSLPFSLSLFLSLSLSLITSVEKVRVSSVLLCVLLFFVCFILFACPVFVRVFYFFWKLPQLEKSVFSV